MLQILQGDVLSTLRRIPDASVRCVCTSPPYYNLRAYLRADDPLKRFEIGSERTPAEYIAKMVEVFAAVRRVMADDATLWLNLGDSSCGSRKGAGDVCSTNKANGASRGTGRTRLANGRGDQPAILRQKVEDALPQTCAHEGFKAKDIMGMPWRVALALHADGWYLRSGIPWIKRNVMPESVEDRPTHAVEYVFLLSKSPTYYYNKAATMVAASKNTHARQSQDAEFETMRASAGSPRRDAPHDSIESRKARAHNGQKSFPDKERNGIRSVGIGSNARPRKGCPNGAGGKMDAALAVTVLARNRRNSDWLMESWQGLLADEDGDPLAFIVNPQGYKDAHFATWPERLVRPMILAGSAPGDTVLDPFGGSGTTGKVALELGRKAILCELNADYIPLIRQRCETTVGLPI